jgi:hypothetical protein
MYDWYTRYYVATRDSAAHAALCERVYGRNFAQHGFADMAQLDKLLEVCRRRTCALSLSCLGS